VVELLADGDGDEGGDDDGRGDERGLDGQGERLECIEGDGVAMGVHGRVTGIGLRVVGFCFQLGAGFGDAFDGFIVIDAK